MATILIVDDEELMLALLERLLETHCPPSTRILMAKNGQQGIQRYEESGADLILVDCIMPVMTGIELVYLLRSRGVITPIIMTSGFPNQEATAYAAGATLFAEKVALPGQLPQIISRFLPT